MAVNCLVVPAAMPGLVGETWIDDNVAEVTVRIVLPDLVPRVAAIVVCPAATAVANPLESIVARP